MNEELQSKGYLVVAGKVPKTFRKTKFYVYNQQNQISHLTNKIMEQSGIIVQLQEKAFDLRRLERHMGREQVQAIVRTG